MWAFSNLEFTSCINAKGKRHMQRPWVWIKRNDWMCVALYRTRRLHSDQHVRRVSNVSLYCCPFPNWKFPISTNNNVKILVNPVGKCLNRLFLPIGPRAKFIPSMCLAHSTHLWPKLARQRWWLSFAAIQQPLASTPTFVRRVSTQSVSTICFSMASILTVVHHLVSRPLKYIRWTINSLQGYCQIFIQLEKHEILSLVLINKYWLASFRLYGHVFKISYWVCRI